MTDLGEPKRVEEVQPNSVPQPQQVPEETEDTEKVETTPERDRETVPA